MVIVSTQGKASIVGKVLRITFEKPGVKYLEFELPGGDKRFCRGNAAPGKNFDNLTKGANVRLFGKWGVSNNPQYKSMGEQFNFSDYELLTATEATSRKTPEVTSSAAGEASTQHQEEVRGSIVRFRPFTSDYRIFLLHAIDGHELWCQGAIDPSKVPYENNKVRLTGNLRINPRRPEFGKQFYFTSYDIITSGKPEKVIRRPRSGSQTINSTISRDNVAEKVAAYLKVIGGKKITYEFNSPKHDTISRHVLQQLNDRVIHATAENKDFYFLTALLDRNVPDSEVQLFRRSNPDFKMKLLQCWRDAETEFVKITNNIRRTLSDRKYLSSIFENSNAVQLLTDTVTGEYGINQLLVCLKVIRDKYNIDASCNINDWIRDLVDEQALKQYLISIYGVSHKISNWSLTNITGHWFVIDEPNIKPLIQKDLAESLPSGLEVTAENADTLFKYWFGTLDEERKDYSNFSHDRFREAFPDFSMESCEFLPFIVTQYLWFYGKYYLD